MSRTKSMAGLAAIAAIAALVTLAVREGPAATAPATQPAPPALPGFTVASESTNAANGDVTVIYAPLPATKPAPATTQSYVVAPRVLTTQPVVSVNHTADQVILNLLIRGTGQNITCQNYQGNLLIDNVVSVDAWSASQFSGQGAYLGNIAGNITIQNSYFGFNGRPRAPPLGQGPQTPTEWKHDIYCDATGGALSVTGCILSNAANAGIQSRAIKGSTFDNDVFLDCGIALLLIEGGATIDNCVIWGGNYYFDGTAYTGCDAIRSYWPAKIINTYVLTRANQVVPIVAVNHPGAKYSAQGGVNVGGQWVHTDPSWTPPAGYPNIAEYLTGGGNVINSDWPGGLFAGPTKGVGFTTLKGPGPALNYAPILAKVEAGGSVAEAIASIRTALGVR